MAKKVKLKKRNVSIAVGCVVVVLVLIGGLFRWKQELDYQKTYEYKLQHHGYSKEDTAYLLQNCTDKEMDEILKKDANETVIEEVKDKKLFEQEKYYMKKNADQYFAYWQEHKNDVINEDGEVVKASSQSGNHTLTMTDVVAIVNVGANKDWYTDAVEADTSKDYLLLTNKFHSLSKDYEPEDLEVIKNWYAFGDGPMLRREAYQQFISLYNAAKEEGHDVIIESAYRDFAYQESLYNDYLITYGQKGTDDIAARAGFSEHQTGLTVDVTTYSANNSTFETFEEFTWLQNHAHEYGFILRYPKGKKYITGYNYESWHYRYVGVEVATYIHEHGITFDEYYAYFIEGE